MDSFNCFWQQRWDRTQLLSAQAKNALSLDRNKELHTYQGSLFSNFKCFIKTSVTFRVLYRLPFLCNRISKEKMYWSIWILKQNVITFHRQHCLTSMVSQITQTWYSMNNIIRLINTRLCNGLCLLLAWE